MPKSDIEWAVGEFKENHETYEAYNNYYGGVHPLLFATEKFRNTFGNLFQSFADNLCPAVVDAVANRQRIEGWDGTDAKKVEEHWTKSKLKRASKDVFREARKCGDSYLLVWPNEDGKVVYWPHDADQCCVEYDDEDDPTKIIKASKVWTNKDDFCRINVYYEDHIQKWITRTKCTDETGMPTDVRKWVRFSKDVDNPYGIVPIFHFATNAKIGQMGESLLKDVIPLQNALNKSVCDMLVAGEFVAYPQRWATGLQIEVDEDTGKPKNPPFVPGVDRVWTAAGEVKFGEFSAADLAGFTEVQASFRAEISRVSGTPSHFLNLDAVWPSGEALKVAEGRLIKMIENCNTDDTEGMKGATALGLEMDGKGTDLDFEPIWANAAPHNPLLDAETQLVKQQVGVSKERSLSELGYSDKMIKEMMAQVEAMNKKAADLAMQSVAPPGGPTAFTRNGSPGQASKPAAQQQQKDKVPVPKPKAGAGQWSDS